MWSLQHFTFNPAQENTYLLWNDEREAIIIDPGAYYENEKNILKDFINANQLHPKLLINTHCHLDHIFSEKFVAETWNLIPYIHKEEQIVMQAGEMSGKMWGLPFENYAGPIHFLKEGDHIGFGKDILQVLYTPGHSPGHVCFYCPKENFVIAGDVLFKGSIGRTDLPGGNYELLIHNIKTKLLVLPDETMVYNGHGPVTTIGDERKTNPFIVM